MTVCPDCLKAEFGAAPAAQEAVRLVDTEEYRRASRRQKERAMRLAQNLESGAAFNVSGKLRFALGLVIFAVCTFIFILGDSPDFSTPVSRLPMDSQRIVSAGLCGVAALLVFMSFRRHKFVVGLLTLGMLVTGWYMPEIWRYRAAEPLKPVETKKTEAEKKTAEPVEPERRNAGVLTPAELEVYTEECKRSPHKTHYAVYMTTQDSASRSVVRDALTRLLEAEYTRPYTRGDGALFVVVNAREARRDITGLLSRFGQVSYARPGDGLYEVRFMPEHANMVCRYSPEVLSSPANPAFVQANLSELTCMDPLRVRTAAQVLRNADVPALRRDIHATLLRVLGEPWMNEPDTYRTLIEALVTYAPQGDAKTLTICRDYFQSCRARRQSASASVIQLLIREVPDEMVEPVVEMWSVNPIAWNRVLTNLGSKAEDEIIRLLDRTDRIQTITTILNYIREYGTAKSIPSVEKLVQHRDSLISHTARNTLEVLKKR